MALPKDIGPEAGAARAQEFLELIERGRRGKLKIYIGSSAGVGKSYRMLQESQALKAKGVDVVLGFIETHGRAETEALVAGLDVVPRARISYRGIVLEDMDLPAVLARAPQVVVVDELAHSNAPGLTHQKRYEDVLALVRAGINVLTAVNIQHLESLNDLVARMTGVAVRETIPDSLLRQADQVVNIDLSVEDLRERLEAGKIYPKEKISSALAHFFEEQNLAALRELALREVAESAERQARRATVKAGEKAQGLNGLAGPAQGRVGRLMLALSTHATNGPALVRKGSRIAGRLDTRWYVVHVERPGSETATLPAAELRHLADAFELARSLGAQVVRLQDRDPARALVAFARKNDVERIVLGRSRRPRWQQRVFGTLPQQLIELADGFDVQVVSVSAEGTEAGEKDSSP